jgi:hypothetical protein
MKKPAAALREPLKLLPLLIVYALFVVLKSKTDLQWDEGRYFLNARNLLKGGFASTETLMFWNGPGYPLYLLPFVALKAPLLLPKLGNAVFLYFAIVYFQASLRLLGCPAYRSRYYAYALGILSLLHGSLIEFLMTESLSALLVSGAAYHYLRATLRADRPRIHLGASGLHLGYLALTKVFFGYVLTAGLILAGAWWLWALTRKGRGAASSHGGALAAASPKSSSALPKSAAVSSKYPASAAALACGLGLLFCAPYLAYTHAKTGRLFFWSNSGGSQLYCMTLGEKEFLGDWLNFEEVLFFPEFFKQQTVFYRELDKMDYLSRDQAFKQAALRNLRHHPRKVFQNWRANVNRMVFGFPVSRYPGSDPELATGNRSFVYALPFYLCLIALWPAWTRRRQLSAPLWGALGFALVALGGLSLLSAIPRMVFPLLPIVGLWLAAVNEAAARARRLATGAPADMNRSRL